MNALAKLSRANVATHTSVTECAMMSTTMLVATGTKAIAAVQPKPTKPRFAPSASAKIVKPTSKSARQKQATVLHPNGKETRTATTETIIVHAPGMAGTAAVKKIRTSIAKSATVRTRKNKSAPESADRLVGPMTASATTTITTVVVGGTKVTAAATRATQNNASSAKTASVWIPIAQTSRRPCASASAATRTGQEMVFATVATTTAAAHMTKVIVVVTREIQSKWTFARARNFANV